MRRAEKMRTEKTRAERTKRVEKARPRDAVDFCLFCLFFRMTSDAIRGTCEWKGCMPLSHLLVGVQGSGFRVKGYGLRVKS